MDNHLEFFLNVKNWKITREERLFTIHYDCSADNAATKKIVRMEFDFVKNVSQKDQWGRVLYGCFKAAYASVGNYDFLPTFEQTKIEKDIDARITLILKEVK